MKVTLIFPRGHFDHDLMFRSFPVVQVIKSLPRPFLSQLIQAQSSNLIPPTGLLKLAALTPPEVEVSVIDERVRSINTITGADLFGITAVTKTVPRAYEIATQLRIQGAKVVLGGPHATVMPEEALQYVDAVAVGEGEYIWPCIIEDVRRDQLKPTYHSTTPTVPDDIPLPRLDLIEPGNYGPVYVLEATRGCPHSCSYCTVKSMWGQRLRRRPISSILDELSGCSIKLVFFASDNLSADRQYAKDLFRAIRPLKIHWAGFCTVRAAMDTEFLDLAVASGCVALLLGFESLSKATLSEIHKQSTNNLSNYEAVIHNLHNRGIVVGAGFLFGLDHDEPCAFEEVVDFIEANRVECPNINIVVPYPGTELYDRLEREGRILHKDWTYYDTGASYVVFQPAKMSASELRRHYLWTEGRIFSYSSILRRISHVRAPLQAAMALQYNIGQRYIHQRNLREHIDPKTQRHV